MKLAPTKKYFKLSIIALSALAYGLSAQTVSADIINPAVGNLGNNAENARAGLTFVEYFIALWSGVIAIGAITVLVAFIWGAIDWVNSAGDSGKLDKARNRMLHAALGLLILVGSYTIVSFISYLFFGEAFNVLQPVIPDPGDLL